jgi:choice-of-anchor B domain-containing protein
MTRVGIYNPPNMPSTPGGVIYNDVWGYTASDGSEYAILGNSDSILVVDVSICNDPQRVYGFDGGNTTVWRDFKTYQDYMYAVCDNCTEGLHIFDMSGLPNGNVTHVLTTTAFFTKAHNIYVDTATQKLYVAGSNGATEGLTILDLSTPANPTLIEDIEFDDEIGMPSSNFYVHDVYVQNDTAYCSHGYTGFYVWDMTNLNNIELLGSYDSPGYNHSSWIDATGSYSYYAEEVPRGRPMAVVDLANLGHPVNDIQVIHTFKDPISTVENDVTPHNPFVHNDSLFISYYEDGIKVYDLINPESPTLVAYYDTYPDNGTAYTGYDGNWGAYPFFDSGCILASDVEYGLNTLNVIPCPNPVTYYRDSDDDGYGDPNNSYTGCAQAEGWVTNNSDCDDSNDLINPDASEVCDDIDNDCDNLIDDDDPDAIAGNNTFYIDDDGDGFGNAQITIMSCTAPAGYVEDNTDCDDSNPNINPDAPEVCDGIDNNCNNQIDEGGLTTFYADADGDGFGDINVTIQDCTAPANYVADNTDCDDNDPNINPNATETCDGIDNNCNNQIDEGALLTFYADVDGDNFGDNNVSVQACTAPANYVTDNTDCDDNNPNINPNATELCDGIDNNCNNNVDENCPLDPCDDVNLYINPATQNIYRAKQTIDSDATITNTQDIEYYAGQTINLDQGFEVVLGAEFLAQIKDCDNSALVSQTRIHELSGYNYENDDSKSYEIVLYKGNQMVKQFQDISKFKEYIRTIDVEGYTIKVTKK